MEIFLVNIAACSLALTTSLLLYRVLSSGTHAAYFRGGSSGGQLRLLVRSLIGKFGSFSCIEKFYSCLELEPSFRKLNWCLSSRFPTLYPEKLSTYECFVGYVLCAVLSAGIAAGILPSPLSCLMSQLLLAFLAYRLYTSEKKKYQRSLHEALPELYRSLSTALSSGKSLQQACAYVGKRGHPFIAEAFSEAAYKMQTGTAHIIALEELELQLQIPSIELIGSALTISQRTGCALRDLFEKASIAVMRSSELRRELQVKTSQAQLSSKLVSGLPLILLLLMALVSSDFRAGMYTPIGLSCIVIGLLLDFIGLIVIRSYLRLEV